jgi:hypothetical protein
MMPVKLAVFSLSASSPDGDDSRYLRWHALDHLPQQYEIPGVLFGQRFVSTPECRAARAAQSERLEPVNHVVYYLFGEPVTETVDAFFALRDHLIEIGRFPERLPNRLVAGCDLVAAHAAPSALVTADVVPYRPNLGAYLVIERGDDPAEGAPWTPESVDSLLAIDGVAGMWNFAPTTVPSDDFSKSGYSVTLVYLDEDPVEVARSIGSLLTDRWERRALTPALAAPFVTLRPFEWARHARPG